MSSPRLVSAPISLYFSVSTLDKEAYQREYQQLSESDEDPISQWLKLAKSKGDTRETDPVSAFGGIIGFNRKVGVDTAEEILKKKIRKFSKVRCGCGCGCGPWVWPVGGRRI